MPYLELDGNMVYFAGNQDKEGIPLLFCHGSGGGHHHWLYQLKAMPPPVKPLAFDLPGHGRSDNTPLDDVYMYRDWLKLFSQSFGLKNFILTGHSLGGAIAMAYALEHPEDLHGLILVGTGARLRVLPAFLEELKQGRVPETMIEYLYAPGASEELISLGLREMKNTAPEVYLADLTACDNFDIRENLSQISLPTLIICGSEDSLTPVKYSQFLKENIPQSRLEIIEGAGHMAMLEQPDAVNRAIAKFIEEDLL